MILMQTEDLKPVVYTSPSRGLQLNEGKNDLCVRSLRKSTKNFIFECQKMNKRQGVILKMQVITNDK